MPPPAVEGQLAHGDLDAADTPVADAEDRFGVGAHDQVHVVRFEGEGFERLGDLVGLVDA